MCFGLKQFDRAEKIERFYAKNFRLAKSLEFFRFLCEQSIAIFAVLGLTKDWLFLLPKNPGQARDIFDNGSQPKDDISLHKVLWLMSFFCATTD